MEECKMDIRQAMQKIALFLARRDLPALHPVSLPKKGQASGAMEVLILLGSALPYTVKVAAQAYRMGMVKSILVSGGVGHSTELLYRALAEKPYGYNVETAGRPEADILRDLLIEAEDVPPKAIFVENKSTNCGDNAVLSLQLLRENIMEKGALLLIQDPLMQRRTHASFMHCLENEAIAVFSYAPFLPVVGSDLQPDNKEVSGLWTKQRFWELLAGEIPRLTDGPDGYGPSGKDFIAHVDIPEDIRLANEVLQLYLSRQGLKQR